MGENPAALRAAVFSLASKNLRGGGAFKRPPAGRGLIVFQARKHEKAKRKSEKPVPCSQADSVNAKSYEDGNDVDVPQARIFAVWNHETSLTHDKLWY